MDWSEVFMAHGCESRSKDELHVGGCRRYEWASIRPLAGDGFSPRPRPVAGMNTAQAPTAAQSKPAEKR
jgi:hypothetical protein